MPWHMQPRLRDKEIILETVGLQQTRDSQGVTVLKADEAAGKRPPKEADKCQYWIQGTVYTPTT